jgi:nucleotide-binding universal stress UspA family protein
MTLKNILVHMDSGPRCTVRLDIAIQLAKRFDARLTGLFAQSESYGPSIVARRSSESLRNAADEAKALFLARSAEAGVAGQWWQLSYGEHGHVISETVICCRYADLAIFGQHDHSRPEYNKTPEDLVEQVMLNSGRPVLVIPYAGDYPDVGSQVFVAWNGSREAARALNDSLPFLHAAKAVTVLSIQQDSGGDQALTVPTVDILDHLAAHGIKATMDRCSITGTIMDTVLNRTFDDKGDLLVMGGYGNYGFPYFYRGGNTRHILRQMTLPVLFSH